MISLGAKQVSLTMGMEENIGLAVFGGQNQLIHECTDDLDLILKSIGVFNHDSTYAC